MLHRTRRLLWAGFGQLVGSWLRSGNLAVIWSGTGRELVDPPLVIHLGGVLVAVQLGKLEALGVVMLQYRQPIERVCRIPGVVIATTDKMVVRFIPHVKDAA
jgi:hypothetical protein